MIIKYKSTISSRYSAIHHIHNTVTNVQLKELIALIDHKTGERTREQPPFIQQGQETIARFQLIQAICI